MKIEKDFYNLEELQKHIQKGKGVNYLELFDYGSPRNHDYLHNYKSTPVFEYLLKNVPDMWQKVEYKKEYSFDSYLDCVKPGEPIVLAEKVSGIIRHYAREDYWKQFVEKLGQDITAYPQQEHKAMWTYATLNFSADIFLESILHNEAKKSIGEKELNSIYLNHIDELSISHRWQIDSALRSCSKTDLVELITACAEKEDFYSILNIQENRSLKETKILPNVAILEIKVGEQTLEQYLQDKKQEYTVHITGEPIKKGSHETIDGLFRRELLADMEEHCYKLNYFNLVKVMKKLDIPNIEDTMTAEIKIQKRKMK